MPDVSNADSSNVGSFQSVGDASHASTNLCDYGDSADVQQLTSSVRDNLDGTFLLLCT